MSFFPAKGLAIGETANLLRRSFSFSFLSSSPSLAIAVPRATGAMRWGVLRSGAADGAKVGRGGGEKDCAREARGAMATASSLKPLLGFWQGGGDFKP